MQSLLYQLSNDENWLEYLNFKRNQASISKIEILELEKYINNKEYRTIVSQILNSNYKFSVPEKHLINKINKTKKRVVYSFNKDENMILKMITYLFSKKYDEKYSSNCFSFRKKYTVKDAINRLSKASNINELYGYKIDIENYFNSVNIEILLKKLENFLEEDKELYNFIKEIITDNRVRFRDNIEFEEKGIMAGVPISSFLANIYLQEVDEFFEKNNVLYIRYSDDIIFFTKKDKIDYYMKKLQELIRMNKLNLNMEKIQFIKPHEKWDFLGFSYENGIIDISEIAKKKVKGKIKRASRKLRKWMIKNNANSNRAISAVIRKFNRKFYMIENKNELTWQLWYFPVINTSKSLHEIDLYMQECLRYIKTGKYNKKNYNLRYEELKQMGYRPLVSEFYKNRKSKT